MRFHPADLCLLVGVFAFINLLVLAVFAPKHWRSGHFLRQDVGRINKSAVPNTVVVFYQVERSRSPYTSCPEKSDHLVGSIIVNLSSTVDIDWNVSVSAPPKEDYLLSSSQLNITEAFTTTYIFEPLHCSPIHTVAIIIPFRDRESHLKILLGHLVPVLQRQLIRYSIFVISQVGVGIFNKGRLMNTGFEFSLRTGERSGTPFDCFVFQDVDLLVEHDTLLYRCSKGNVVDHLSTAINKFDYKPLCCGMTVGGVLAFKKEQFREVNGFPNSYWGWGGEDDDISRRIKFFRMRVIRPNPQQGRYTMIKHERDRLNPYNEQVTKKNRLALTKFRTDGLSNFMTTILEVKSFAFFTLVKVDVGKPT